MLVVSVDVLNMFVWTVNWSTSGNVASMLAREASSSSANKIKICITTYFNKTSIGKVTPLRFWWTLKSRVVDHRLLLSSCHVRGPMSRNMDVAEDRVEIHLVLLLLILAYIWHTCGQFLLWNSRWLWSFRFLPCSTHTPPRPRPVAPHIPPVLPWASWFSWVDLCIFPCAHHPAFLYFVDWCRHSFSIKFCSLIFHFHA